MACLAIVIIASVMLVLLPKLGQSKIPSQNIATIATLTPTPDNSLCSGDTSGSPLSSGRIDKSHPFHQDDGQATQIDQGGFTPITLCRQIKASNYVISFHVLSPYILLYLYDSNHKKYEIDYNIYADHISVVAYPGFSMANSVSVGQGTYSNSSANWHTDQINFTSNMVKVLVDGTEVISGSTGFTDDGSGDDLLIQSHQITMDQFSVTQL